MKSVVIHRVVECKHVVTRYGDKYVAEVEILNQGKQQFWLSIKQGEKLVECADRLKNGYSTKHIELHAVIDDSGDKPRFVWCGLHSARHSDLPFLSEKFGVTCTPAYIETPDAGEREVHEQLLDGGGDWPANARFQEVAKARTFAELQSEVKKAREAMDDADADSINELASEFECRRHELIEAGDPDAMGSFEK